MMSLRPYQEAARVAVHEHWRDYDRILVVKPTGTGKTILFSAITRDVVSEGGRVLILAHRGELLQQAADKLSASTGLACAVEKAEFESHDALERVTVGSVQTMMRPSRLARFADDHFTHIIVDEAHHCFSAGVLIDGKPIEAIHAGDFVLSFDHLTKRVERKKVLETMKSRPSSLCVLKFSNGASFSCTHDHPVFSLSDGRYKRAVDLSANDMVLTTIRKEESESCSGSGREQPQSYCPQAGRRTEGCIAETAWVESVEVLERGRDGTFGGMCPDGFVYNIEVEGNHNYFADGVLVHNCLADSYQAAMGYFSNAKILGVTATPDRNDKKNLGSYFEALAYEYSLIAAIRDGWLAPIRALSVPLQIDLRKVSMQNGDFKASDLDDALAPYMAQIAQEMKDRCSDRKTLAFVPLIATAQRFAEVLRGAGLDAQWISGDDPDRGTKLATYAKAGPGTVLVNSMLLTEGYDDPATDCIVCLRPTKSRPLYAQIVGRGTRINPGKKDLLLLDFLWMTERHELCRPSNLVSDSDAMARVMTKATETAGTDGMLLDDAAMDEAKREVVHEREKALAEELGKQRQKKARLVDPLQWAVSVNAEDLTDYEPGFGWEAGPPSRKQLERLETSGIDAEAVTCAGMASKLIDRIESRKAAGFATARQVRLLERKGFQHVGEMTFSEANRIITRISANGWRLPDDLVEQIQNQRHGKARPQTSVRTTETADLFEGFPV